MKRFSLIAAALVQTASAFSSHAQTVDGLDVSQWQGVINWSQVAASDNEFVYIKATDSQDINDPRFRVNGPGASNTDLLVGVYHFATPYSYTRNSPIDLAAGSDAVAEAQWFVQRAGAYMQPGNLPPVLDLEVNSSLGKTVLSNWAAEFLDEVESLVGVRPIIYANSNWAMNFLDANVVDTDLWVANWGASSNPSTGTWSDYAFWQYTALGGSPGIDPNFNTTDLNVFNGTRQELEAYTIPLMGDMWNDGTLDLLDIQFFILALTDPDAYTAVLGFAPTRSGDFNNDGLFNLDDVQSFAQLLGDDAAPLLALVPEPTAALVFLALPCLFATRRRR